MRGLLNGVDEVIKERAVSSWCPVYQLEQLGGWGEAMYGGRGVCVEVGWV